MNQDETKNLYWILTEVLENCNSIIRGACDDIDCPKYALRDELKKPADVIDHKSCVQKAQSDKATILKFLLEPRFRKYRYEKCCVCHKLVDRLSEKFHIETITGKPTEKPLGKFGKCYPMYFYKMHKACKKKWKEPVKLIT